MEFVSADGQETQTHFARAASDREGFYFGECPIGHTSKQLQRRYKYNEPPPHSCIRSVENLFPFFLSTSSLSPCYPSSSFLYTPSRLHIRCGCSGTLLGLTSVSRPQGSGERSTRRTQGYVNMVCTQWRVHLIRRMRQPHCVYILVRTHI